MTLDLASNQDAKTVGFTTDTLELRAFLRRETATADLWSSPSCRVELRHDHSGAWLLVLGAQGDIALRCAPLRHVSSFHAEPGLGDQYRLRLKGEEGVFSVCIDKLAEGLLRVRTTILPADNLIVDSWPRDLYPLGAGLDPCRAIGHVEASQRGLNTALCFLALSAGSALYVQNLTALNPYFEQTQSKPDGAVGGEWPELGYKPPTTTRAPEPRPLQSGAPILISDCFLAVSPAALDNEQASARAFLTMLGHIYPHLDKPSPDSHDWAKRAEHTLKDLARTADARQHYKGCVYPRAYVGGEHPDSMVQATLASSIATYEHALGLGDARSRELTAGMKHFFDEDLGALKRFLPNVGADKDSDEVDSWYLYYPLLHLARLALLGNEEAATQLWRALPFAITAAQRFDYQWPIKFKFSTLETTKRARDGDGNGQTDVGGLYAYLMLRAHELSGEPDYLREAQVAIRAACGKRFELTYQTNLTAWGAVACLEIAERDDDAFFRDQSYVYVANFLHNCEMWESEIGHAKHYRNFLGATCLHDSPYMAAFECFESFVAFREYLARGSESLSHALRVMLRDYCVHALDRAWYYYPEELPAEALSKEVRSGRIDRRLSFPLEDLYADGQPAGQVGQEVYGAGGALLFAALGAPPT
jgi:hypothetical protein